MPGFRPGDIVRVPFPYVERSVQQHRPALVIGLPDAPSPLLWVLMVTSAANQAWPGDVAIGPGGTTGLPVRSLVRTAKIATVEQAAASPLGRVSVTELQAISALVRRSMGLEQAEHGAR